MDYLTCENLKAIMYVPGHLNCWLMMFHALDEDGNVDKTLSGVWIRPPAYLVPAILRRVTLVHAKTAVTPYTSVLANLTGSTDNEAVKKECIGLVLEGLCEHGPFPEDRGFRENIVTAIGKESSFTKSMGRLTGKHDGINKLTSMKPPVVYSVSVVSKRPFLDTAGSFADFVDPTGRFWECARATAKDEGTPYMLIVRPVGGGEGGVAWAYHAYGFVVSHRTGDVTVINPHTPTATLEEALRELGGAEDMYRFHAKQVDMPVEGVQGAVGATLSFLGVNPLEFLCTEEFGPCPLSFLTEVTGITTQAVEVAFLQQLCESKKGEMGELKHGPARVILIVTKRSALPLLLMFGGRLLGKTFQVWNPANGKKTQLTENAFGCGGFVRAVEVMYRRPAPCQTTNVHVVGVAHQTIYR